jgi:aminoglycoside 3-N-acetyltransferase
MRSQQSLTRDLTALGVRSGDVLFVHSSFKSLGAVEGGAASVIGALIKVLGAEGTLLMPSFNLVGSMEERAARWDIGDTPSSVGYLTEYFRRMPGVLRSDHYSHSVAARGAQADWITRDHLSQRGAPSPWDREPWGRTFGSDSPFARGLEAGVKVLLLGVDYGCLTYVHLVETLHRAARAVGNPLAKHWYVKREVCGAWWEEHGEIARGSIGDAPSLLFFAQSFVEALLAETLQHPQKYFRWMD